MTAGNNKKRPPDNNPSLQNARRIFAADDSVPGGRRELMSVREMGDQLGLKKTERYWLVHRGYFITEAINGKMWVDVQSFEEWYANQWKYRKVTGEETCVELRKQTYSVHDLASLLRITESSVYRLLEKKPFDTIKAGPATRIPKNSFHTWYEGQQHYRTAEDAEKDKELENDSLSIPQAASLLGLQRRQFHRILTSSDYGHFFQEVTCKGRRRITKESFGAFLNGQSEYSLQTRQPDHSKTQTDPEDFICPPALQSLEYITVAQASECAHISRQAVLKYARYGYFEVFICRRIIRIKRKDFFRWMGNRKRKPPLPSGSFAIQDHVKGSNNHCSLRVNVEDK